MWIDYNIFQKLRRLSIWNELTSSDILNTRSYIALVWLLILARRNLSRYFFLSWKEKNFII